MISSRGRPGAGARLAGAAVASLVLIAAALTLVLWMRPPELLRVGAGYAAKMVCSNVFIAGRRPSDVLREDVQSTGPWLLKLMRVQVDSESGTVRAGLFGFLGDGLAIARPQAGCAVIPDGRVPESRDLSRPGDATDRQPAHTTASDATAVQRALADERFAGPGMRAIVVVREGRLVAERYAGGFDPATPQLGWSMTKTVTAVLVGLLIKDGRLTLDQAGEWPPGDPRARIRIADLLSMTSGLEFNESYGTVSDVTRMLYLSPDMAEFAHAKRLVHPVGSAWSYSSGTAVLLARIAQDAAGPAGAHYPRSRLFDPLDMKSAVMETDERGTWVGSSYMYATPRDWARFGQLLAQDGVWQGRELLPRGYVAMMSSAAPGSGGEYGRGMVWRRVSQGDKPRENPETSSGIPDDAFWMVGFNGQYAAVVPSRQLVVVRMGLTPDAAGYHPEPLLAAVLQALR